MHFLIYGVQDIRNYNVPCYQPKFVFGGVSYILDRKLILKSLYICCKNQLLVLLFVSTTMNIAQPN
jgi:hypothetical protein